MINKIASLAGIFLSVFILSSCTLEIVDRPDYYRDYDDKAAGVYNYNYSYSPGYSSARVVVPTPTPAVIVKFITLKTAGNNYYFYENGREIAVWLFKDDGTVARKGRIINGLVRRFYDGTDTAESEIMFKNGERWGACKKYYPNGMLKEIINYNNGDRDGNYTAFYPNGRVIEEGEYKRGNRYGNYQKYSEDGGLQEKGVFEHNAPRITYVNASPTPPPHSADINTNQVSNHDNNAWRGGNTSGTKNNNSGSTGGNGFTNRAAAATPAVYATPVVIKERVEVPVVTQVVVKERVEVPVQVTVAVTATPAPAATEEKHDEALLKTGAKGETGAIKDVMKEGNRDIRKEVKNVKEAAKDAEKEISKPAETEGKKITGGLKVNAERASKPLKVRLQNKSAKEETAVTAGDEVNTEETKGANREEGSRVKEAGNRDKNDVKEQDVTEKHDEKSVKDNENNGDNRNHGENQGNDK